MSYEIILDVTTNKEIKRDYTIEEIAEGENNLIKLNAEKEKMQGQKEALLKVIEKLTALGLNIDDLNALGIEAQSL